MNPERWRQIDQLLEAALDRKPEERAAFLAVACADDESLRLEVESLLRSDEAAESFIEEPVVALAADVIAERQVQALAGRRISHYKILSRLGSGGMGEVYLAEDLKLARKVAIKLLPPPMTADEQARKRLLREARAAAALDHPNICTIHEVGDEAGRSFIVMQYIEGETLAARIKRGRLELSEALAIAIQMAEALQEAHQHGIIHRDIKPQNLMLTARGQVKVLDFGLAKVARERVEGPEEADTSSLMSTPGAIVGTAPYMSPEQVRGERLDVRSDIFSFGTTLYEMVSGRRPFEGDTTSDVIAAILRSEPPTAGQFRPDLPPAMERIISQMLTKDRSARYQSAADLRADLQRLQRKMDVATDLTSASETTARRRTTGEALRHLLPPLRRFLRRIAVPGGLLVIVSGAGLAWWNAYRTPPGTPRSELRISQIASVKFGAGPGIPWVNSSPEGKLIAWHAGANGKSGIWVKQIVGGEPKQITDGKWVDRDPTWAPDGQLLAFISDRGGTPGIWSVPYMGGAPTLLREVSDLDSKNLVAWSQDGQTIYYEAKNNLYAMRLASGQTTHLTQFSSEGAQVFHYTLSPGEDQITYTKMINGKWRVEVATLRGGAARQITGAGWNDRSPKWLPDGRRLAFLSDRSGLNQVYVAQPDGARLEQITFGSDNYSDLDVSSDGKRIITVAEKENANIFSCDVRTGAEVGHTSDFGLQLFPDLSPDGERIAFQSSDSGGDENTSLSIKPVATESQAAQLLSPALDPRWSPDGKTLAFLRRSADRYEIRKVSPDGKNESLLATDVWFTSRTGVPYNWKADFYNWSPDGAKIAYCSGKSGQHNLWTVASGGGSDTMISRNADEKLWIASPLWAPDGSRIACIAEPKGPYASEKVWGVWLVGQGMTKTVFQNGGPLRLIGWSASGRELIVAAGERKPPTYAQNVTLIRVPAEAGAAQTIARLPAAYLHNIRISYDRLSVAFVSRQDGTDNIRLIPVSGGPTRKLTRNSDPTIFYSGLKWSPNGRMLFYSRQSNWSVVSMIENFK